MPPTVLITRPLTSARRLANQLRDKWGSEVQIIISPLMQITYVDDAPDLDGIKTLIFTSRHGVEGFSRLSNRRDIPCYAVGTATATQARKLGFVTTDAGGDASALSHRIIADGRRNCLHVRGEHAAGDVVADLMATGIEARDHILYRQEAVPLTEEAFDALNRESAVILPLFSPRSAALFFDSISGTAPLLVAAISQSVANKVPDGVPATTIIAENPNAEAMIETLDTLYQHAIRVEGANPAQ